MKLTLIIIFSINFLNLTVFASGDKRVVKKDNRKNGHIVYHINSRRSMSFIHHDKEGKLGFTIHIFRNNYDLMYSIIHLNESTIISNFSSDYNIFTTHKKNISYPHKIIVYKESSNYFEAYYFKNKEFIPMGNTEYKKEKDRFYKRILEKNSKWNRYSKHLTKQLTRRVTVWMLNLFTSCVLV